MMPKVQPVNGILTIVKSIQNFMVNTSQLRILNGAIQTLKLSIIATGFAPQIVHGEFISHKIAPG